MQIKVKIETAQFQRKLGSLNGRMQNMRPLMRQVSGDLMDAVEENFAKEGRQPRWKRLAASTIRQRTKEGKWPGKILQKSQAGLASSVAPKSDDRSATVSTNLPYARIHQLGGMAGRGRKVRIPARPYLKITQKDYDDIKGRIRRYFLGQGQ